MSPIIGVVGLKHSNFRSVERAFQYLGYQIRVVTNKVEIANTTHLVIPGVSSFGTVVSELKEMEIFDEIKDLYGSQTKVLGLCAGMQIMGYSSKESPGSIGFSWFDWQCHPFLVHGKKRLFHTGWNTIISSHGEGLCQELIDNDFYFNHSFFVPSNESKYENFSCSLFNEVKVLSFVESQNVWGIQFHPEKSQTSGLKVLSKFASWVS